MRKVLILAAGVAAAVSAVAMSLQSPLSPGDGGSLSVAAMTQPVGDTSQFQPCLCPICTQIIGEFNGAVVPVHVANAAFV